MSLILEALRKSEAERQIGRAPGLLTPMPRQQPTAARRWPWLLLIAALIGGALAAAWWFGRQGAGPLVPAPTSETTPAARPEVAASTSGAEVAPTPAPVLNTPPVAQAPASTPPPLSAVGPADQPNDPDFVSVERESVALPAPGINPPAPLPAPLPSVAPLDPAPESLQPVDTAVEPAEPFIASLRTLGAAEREGLPPLRLNMHVYSTEPDQRFVIIDGRRLSEGEAVATDIIVTQIRRDGAVIDVRGRALLLERP